MITDCYGSAPARGPQVHVEYNGKQMPVKEALKHVAATVGLHQRGARAAMTHRLPHGGARGLIAAATGRGVGPCGNVTASEPETSEPGRFVVTKLVRPWHGLRSAA